MSKIKIVQIMVTASLDDTWLQQYLDDKGRVWEFNQAADADKQWVQLDLPEEPTE